MSLVGMGTDRVELDRLRPLLDDHRGRFLKRCFRPGDSARAPAPERDRATLVGASWAAKEALLKALGTDVRRVPYRDISLVWDGGGGPGLRLYGAAEAAFQRTGARSVRVALSTTATSAAAWVVLED